MKMKHLVASTIIDCVKTTAQLHSTDVITVLRFLEKTKEFYDIRQTLSTLASKEKLFSYKDIVQDPSERGIAEALTAYFPIRVTGVREGEIIIGTKTQSKNAILEIGGWEGRDLSEIPSEERIFDTKVVHRPNKEDLDKIRQFPDLWSLFLSQLSSIPFFAGTTRIEKELWLEENQTEKDYYLDDIPQAFAKVLQVQGDITLLSEDVIQQASTSFLSIRDLASKFPAKVGSSGLKGKHTLIFRPGIWKVTTSHVVDPNFKGLVLDLESGLESVGNKNKDIYVFSGWPASFSKERGRWKSSKSTKIGISVPRSLRKCSSLEAFLQESKILDIDKETHSFLEKVTSEFTPASFKSLIQKIIRFRSPQVLFSKDLIWINSGDYTQDKIIDSEIVLGWSIAKLFYMPGSFVPDIQRFVSGAESAMKRAAVSIIEDSWFPKGQEGDILSLLLCAFLIQRLPGWKPGSKFVDKAIWLSVEALHSEKAFDYNIGKGIQTKPFSIVDDTEWKRISAVLDEVRSFETDLGMTRDCAQFDGKKYLTGTEPTKYIPFEHCIDHHWAPEIAYLFPLETVYGMKDPIKPFSQLIGRLFQQITGFNPRKFGSTRHTIPFSEDDPFVKQAREAQKKVYFLRSKKKIKPAKTGKAVLASFEIDPGWISGMVGTIEVTGNPKALVTLHPEDSNVFIAVRKPSRGMKSPFLTDEREAKAIKDAENLLRTKGIRIQKAPLQELIGGKVLLKDDDYYIITKDKKKMKWEQVITQKRKIPLVTFEDKLEDSSLKLMVTGDGQVELAWKKLAQVLKKYDTEDIFRLVSYLTPSSTIEFSKVSRDGSAKTIRDAGAYQLLIEITALFPGAISRAPGRSLIFKSKMIPLLEEIRKAMMNYVTKTEKPQKWEWGKQKDKRKLWDHQTSSVEEMKKKSTRKGHFIWIDVGMGKTLIVLTYLKWLNSQGRLPKYIFYTLPSSAISSVWNEITRFGLDTRLMVPLKTVGKYSGIPQDIIVKGCKPKPFTVNLIEHDHLRRCEETLPISEGIFVIDEVHKCLNETKRTAITQHLSALSKQFIALTGTPVIDSSTYKLLWWLKQIVPFEVDENNFWVAANGMVARVVSTGVKVERQEIEEEFTLDEEKEYSQLVPPSLGGTNNFSNPRSILDAINFCYTVANRGIIREVKKSIKQGNGVFVVAKDKDHAAELFNMFSKFVSQKDMMILSAQKTVFLTDEAVEAGKVHDYKIVITTKRHAEGYTLTRLNTMITSVYPSNNATREQLEGRINRIGQRSKTVTYKIISCGILTYILRNHNDARNLSQVLSSFAKEIQFEQDVPV